MTPYELRFEIFKQAQGMAESKYFTEIEKTKLNRSYGEFPQYPSYEDIEALAERINSFVSSK